MTRDSGVVVVCMRHSSRRSASSEVGGVMPASVNSEIFEDAVAEPSSMPPIEKVTVSPTRQVNVPLASVWPECEGVR